MDVLWLQVLDVASPQPQFGCKHQDCKVTFACRTLSIDLRKNCFNLVHCECAWKVLGARSSCHPDDFCSETPVDFSVVGKMTQELAHN